MAQGNINGKKVGEFPADSPADVFGVIPTGALPENVDVREVMEAALSDDGIPDELKQQFRQLLGEGRTNAGDYVGVYSGLSRSSSASPPVSIGQSAPKNDHSRPPLAVPDTLAARSVIDATRVVTPPQPYVDPSSRVDPPVDIGEITPEEILAAMKAAGLKPGDKIYKSASSYRGRKIVGRIGAFAGALTKTPNRTGFVAAATVAALEYAGRAKYGVDSVFDAGIGMSEAAAYAAGNVGKRVGYYLRNGVRYRRDGRPTLGDRASDLRARSTDLAAKGKRSATSSPGPTTPARRVPPVASPEDTALILESTVEQERKLREELIAAVSYPEFGGRDELDERIERAKSNPNTYKYVKELISIERELGMDKILVTAENLRAEMLAELERLDIEPSDFGWSRSWAIWDLAKQSYLNKHPEESSAEYILGDPFSTDPNEAGSVLVDIVDRHVGWEYDAAQKLLARVRGENGLPDIRHFVRKGDGQLSSEDYRTLGARLRREAGPGDEALALQSAATYLSRSGAAGPTVGHTVEILRPVPINGAHLKEIRRRREEAASKGLYWTKSELVEEARALLKSEGLST